MVLAEVARWKNGELMMTDLAARDHKDKMADRLLRFYRYMLQL